MAKRHGKFTPSLHPRGKNGEFSTKGGGKAANKVDARARRTGYARVGARAGIGVAIGASAIVTGRAQGSHKRQAAGAARIALAGAHAAHGAQTVRRQTSRDFHAMSKNKQAVERRASLKRSAALEAASTIGDAAILGSHGKSKFRTKLNAQSARDKAFLDEMESVLLGGTGRVDGAFGSLVKANKSRASELRAQTAKVELLVRKQKQLRIARVNLNSLLNEGPRDPFKAGGMSVNEKHVVSFKARYLDNKDPWKAVALRPGQKVTPNKPGGPRTMPPDPFKPVVIRNNPKKRRKK